MHNFNEWTIEKRIADIFACVSLDFFYRTKEEYNNLYTLLIFKYLVHQLVAFLINKLLN